LAPGAESWSGFVERAARALRDLAERHRAQTVVVACHAGVVESSLLRLLPIDPGAVRLGLRTRHASMTTWEHLDGRWLLRGYNVGPGPAPAG
jgi:probable phosphoglycerate mutase